MKKYLLFFMFVNISTLFSMSKREAEQDTQRNAKKVCTASIPASKINGIMQKELFKLLAMISKRPGTVLLVVPKEVIRFIIEQVPVHIQDIFKFCKKEILNKTIQGATFNLNNFGITSLEGRIPTLPDTINIISLNFNKITKSPSQDFKKYLRTNFPHIYRILLIGNPFENATAGMDSKKVSVGKNEIIELGFSINLSRFKQ